MLMLSFFEAACCANRRGTEVVPAQVRGGDFFYLSIRQRMVNAYDLPEIQCGSELVKGVGAAPRVSEPLLPS